MRLPGVSSRKKLSAPAVRSTRKANNNKGEIMHSKTVLYTLLLTLAIAPAAAAQNVDRYESG